MEETEPFVVFSKNTISKMNFWGKVLLAVAVCVCVVLEAYILLEQPRSSVGAGRLTVAFLFVAGLGIFGLILCCIRAEGE
ncbi:MAG: hypothetical protein G01um101449_50 [Parcubacteria group bacterium Gr01-1014_49]|nr:MAG: hypothetical protein G01um101449_50 [Parcubacteria group bacterium Gr01-1014_49]